MPRDLNTLRSRTLVREQGRHFSERVTYSRSESSVSLRAVRARPNYVLEDASGLQLKVNHRDWLVEVADLVLASTRVEPKPGDRIEDQHGVVYEVSSPGPGIQHFELDEAPLRYRIHSKQVEG